MLQKALIPPEVPSAFQAKLAFARGWNLSCYDFFNLIEQCSAVLFSSLESDHNTQFSSKKNDGTHGQYFQKVFFKQFILWLIDDHCI